jgi:hypothetical protein
MRVCIPAVLRARSFKTYFFYAEFSRNILKFAVSGFNAGRAGVIA